MTDSYALSHRATADLLDIVEYYARHASETVADHVVARFMEAFQRVADMPDAGVHRTEVQGQIVRSRVVFDYIVFYESNTRPVVILRIIHGASNFIGRKG